MSTITNRVQQQITHLESYVHAYTHIDIVINEVNSMIDRAVVYFEQLLLQLNFLAIGRLTPSIITPDNLRKLIIQIQENIKPPLRLTADPKDELWKFYSYLTCSTLMDRGKIIVTVKIPLLDSREEYEVFKVHTLPIPWLGAAREGISLAATIVSNMPLTTKSSSRSLSIPSRYRTL